MHSWSSAHYRSYGADNGTNLIQYADHEQWEVVQR